MLSGRQLSRIKQEIQTEREAETKRRRENIDLLATRRSTAVDELRNEIPTPTNVLPGNCLPDWCDLRLDQPFPQVPAPCGTFLTSIGHIGERIHPYNFCEFDLSDPLMNQTPIAYNPLHDPHLKGFYQENPQVTKRLVKLGLVCCDGRVVSKLSDFNKYRKYLGRLHNLQVRKAKEQQDRWEQQAYETTRLARMSAETEDKLEFQNRRKLKQLTNVLCDEEERRQQYLGRNRTQHARVAKTRMQLENKIKRSRREILRRETMDRARMRKQSHGDQCQQNVMEWVCKNEHYDNLRKIGRIEKQLNRQEDLCQFIQCKRAYQQSKRMQRHALLSRNKMEQECRATRRQRKYGNAPDNLKRRQHERQKREQARIVREKYLIEKYGRIWLECKRRSAPSPYLNSTWNISNVLQGVVNHVKEEAGCQNFSDLMSAVLKNKKGGKLDPETEQSVQYILDCIMNATMKKYNQRHNSCEVKLEQLQRAYQECFQGIPSPKDFESPSVPRRSRQKQIELPRPSYSSGRRSKSAKAFYDPYWSNDCSGTLDHYKGMACSQLVSQVCQQMQSSCLARSCCRPCGPPCCICFPKSKKLNWCDPVPLSSKRSRSVSANPEPSKQKRKTSRTPKTVNAPTASPRRRTKDNAKSPARSLAPSRKSRGTKGPKTTEKESGNARPYTSEDREAGPNATTDRQIQSQLQTLNRAQQQQTVDDVQNAGIQLKQPEGQNTGTGPMDNQEMKQVEVKPELGEDFTDTVDIPRPSSGPSETQSEREPEVETNTETPETRQGFTDADTPEFSESWMETDERPSSATQKSEEPVDKKEADTGMPETPEKGNQMEIAPSTATEVETDKKYTKARGSQPDEGLSTDQAIDAERPDSRPGTAQSEELPEMGTVTDKQSRRNLALQPDSARDAGTEAGKLDRNDSGGDPIPDSRNNQSTEPQTKTDKGQDADKTEVENRETEAKELKEGGQNPDTVAARNQGSDPSNLSIKEDGTSPDPMKNQGTEIAASVENQETSPERGQDRSVESDKTPIKDQEIGAEVNRDVGQASEPISVGDNAVGPDPGINKGQETEKQTVHDEGTTADVVGKDQAEGLERPDSREGEQNTENTETMDESASVGNVSRSEGAQTTDLAPLDSQATSTEKQPDESPSKGTEPQSAPAQITGPASSGSQATFSGKQPHQSASEGTTPQSELAQIADPTSSDSQVISPAKQLHESASKRDEILPEQAKISGPASSDSQAVWTEKQPHDSTSKGAEFLPEQAQISGPASSDSQAAWTEKQPHDSASKGTESQSEQANTTSSSQKISRQKQPTTYKICDPDRLCSPDEWEAQKISSGEITAAVSMKINSILGDMRDCLQQDCLEGKYDPSKRPFEPLSHIKPPCGNEWTNTGCTSGNRRCSEMNMLGMDCFGVDLKLQEIRKKFIEAPSGSKTGSTERAADSSTSRQHQTSSQQPEGSQAQPETSFNLSSSDAQPGSATITTNQTQTPTSTSVDCSQVRCASLPNPGCLSDRDISRAASTFVSHAIQQEHRRLYDQCLSGSGDENRTGTSGIGKTTQEVLSQERFGVNTVPDTENINSLSSDSQQEQSSPTRTNPTEASGPCSCIKDSVMRHLEQIRRMLAEVSSELETIGVRGCEDRIS